MILRNNPESREFRWFAILLRAVTSILYFDQWWAARVQYQSGSWTRFSSDRIAPADDRLSKRSRQVR